MLYWSSHQALAYFVQQHISHFSSSSENLDLDQLVAFEAEIQFMHNIFRQSCLPNHHYWSNGMGRCGESPSAGGSEC